MTTIFSSMLLYLSVFFSTSIILNTSSKVESIFLPKKILKLILLLIGLFIPAYFAGIRYGIGTDYFAYVSIFNYSSFSVDTRIEPGYILINIIVKILGGNEHFLFFLVEFLTLLFVYLFLNHYKDKVNVGLGILIFLLFYYNYSFNVVRQTLAMSIALYSLIYIDTRKLKRFLIFVLLAMSVHIGAIIVVPFHYLYNSVGKKSNIFRIFMYIITFIGVVNFRPIIAFFSRYILNNPYYMFYTEQGEVNLGIGLFIIYLPYILPGILFFKRLSKDDSFKLYYFLFIIGFILKLIPYFGSAFLDRTADFFIIVLVWIVPYYYRVFKNYKYLFWIPIWPILNTFIYWYMVYINNGAAETVPYLTIFQ